MLSLQITYAQEKYIYHPGSAWQLVRPPEEIVAGAKVGTCLDLSVLFAGLCIDAGLIPILVVLEGHALVVVSLSDNLPNWDYELRAGRKHFIKEPLRTRKPLCDLLESQSMVAIECTGFATYQPLPNQGIDQNAAFTNRLDGVLSFAQAIEVGRELLDDSARDFLFAIDIPMAWWSWGIEEAGGEWKARLPKRRALFVPQVVPDYVHRPDVEELIVERLCNDQRSSRQFVGIWGAPGMGKSQIARCLGNNFEVRGTFAGGVLWASLGKEADYSQILLSWAARLGVSLAINMTYEEMLDEFRAVVSTKDILILLDDVWSADAIQLLHLGSERSCALITSRSKSVLSGLGIRTCDTLKLRDLTLDESYSLFGVVKEHEDNSGEIASLYTHLGGCPMALRQVRAQRDMQVPWAEILEACSGDGVDLAYLDSVVDVDPTVPGLISTIAKSVDQLDERQRNRFFELGLLRPDVPFTQGTAEIVFRAATLDSRRSILLFRTLGLIDQVVTNVDDTAFEMHAVVHACARYHLSKRATEMPSSKNIEDLIVESHQELANRINDSLNSMHPAAVDDSYLCRAYLWHLEQAGYESDIHELMNRRNAAGNTEWFVERLRKGNLGQFSRDLDLAIRSAGRIGRLDLQYAYALRKGSFSRVLSELVQTLLPYQLMRHGAWSIAQVTELQTFFPLDPLYGVERGHLQLCLASHAAVLGDWDAQLSALSKLNEILEERQVEELDDYLIESLYVNGIHGWVERIKTRGCQVARFDLITRLQSIREQSDSEQKAEMLDFSDVEFVEGLALDHLDHLANALNFFERIEPNEHYVESILNIAARIEKGLVRDWCKLVATELSCQLGQEEKAHEIAMTINEPTAKLRAYMKVAVTTDSESKRESLAESAFRILSNVVRDNDTPDIMSYFAGMPRGRVSLDYLLSPDPKLGSAWLTELTADLCLVPELASNWLGNIYRAIDTHSNEWWQISALSAVPEDLRSVDWHSKAIQVWNKTYEQGSSNLLQMLPWLGNLDVETLHSPSEIRSRVFQLMSDRETWSEEDVASLLHLDGSLWPEVLDHLVAKDQKLASKGHSTAIKTGLVTVRNSVIPLDTFPICELSPAADFVKATESTGEMTLEQAIYAVEKLTSRPVSSTKEIVASMSGRLFRPPDEVIQALIDDILVGETIYAVREIAHHLSAAQLADASLRLIGHEEAVYTYTFRCLLEVVPKKSRGSFYEETISAALSHSATPELQTVNNLFAFVQAASEVGIRIRLEGRIAELASRRWNRDSPDRKTYDSIGECLVHLLAHQEADMETAFDALLLSRLRDVQHLFEPGIVDEPTEGFSDLVVNAQESDDFPRIRRALLSAVSGANTRDRRELLLGIADSSGPFWRRLRAELLLEFSIDPIDIGDLERVEAFAEWVQADGSGEEVPRVAEIAGREDAPSAEKIWERICPLLSRLESREILAKTPVLQELGSKISRGQVVRWSTEAYDGRRL
ncbi:MAG: NB-ARC domain-containing protein [Pseudomonadota bacterium]